MGQKMEFKRNSQKDHVYRPSNARKVGGRARRRERNAKEKRTLADIGTLEVDGGRVGRHEETVGFGVLSLD